MSSAFDDFGPEEDGTATRVEDTSPFDDDGYAGYEEHGGFAAAEEARNNFHEFSGEEPPLGFPIDAVPSSILHHHDLASSPSPFSTAESMAKADDGGIFYSDVSVLPPLSEMPSEEGFLRREWRRQNAVYLEEKERREKELRLQTVEEAEEFKKAFYQKREQTCEANKILNREREKLFLINQENFHAAADKQYWKAISELIPNEIPNIEKKKEQKAQEKKPTITVIQGPKPGKPTDLTRLRQILLKLKHNPPLLPPAAGQKDSSGDKLNEVAAGA